MGNVRSDAVQLGKHKQFVRAYVRSVWKEFGVTFNPHPNISLTFMISVAEICLFFN